MKTIFPIAMVMIAFGVVGTLVLAILSPDSSGVSSVPQPDVQSDGPKMQEANNSKIEIESVKAVDESIAKQPKTSITPVEAGQGNTSIQLTMPSDLDASFEENPAIANAKYKKPFRINGWVQGIYSVKGTDFYDIILTKEPTDIKINSLEVALRLQLPRDVFEIDWVVRVSQASAEATQIGTKKNFTVTLSEYRPESSSVSFQRGVGIMNTVNTVRKVNEH